MTTALKPETIHDLHVLRAQLARQLASVEELLRVLTNGLETGPLAPATAVPTVPLLATDPMSRLLYQRQRFGRHHLGTGPSRRQTARLVREAIAALFAADPSAHFKSDEIADRIRSVIGAEHTLTSSSMRLALTNLHQAGKITHIQRSPRGIGSYWTGLVPPGASTPDPPCADSAIPATHPQPTTGDARHENRANDPE